MAPVLSEEFLEIHLKRVRDMIRTYIQMQHTNKYSQHSSITWPLWLNGWVFVYELSGCGFKSSCSHLNIRFRACFEQGVPWHTGNYRLYIHSETRTWHDKNIQLSELITFFYSFTLFYFFSLLRIYRLKKNLYKNHSWRENRCSPQDAPLK